MKLLVLIAAIMFLAGCTQGVITGTPLNEKPSDSSTTPEKAATPSQTENLPAKTQTDNKPIQKETQTIDKPEAKEQPTPTVTSTETGGTCEDSDGGPDTKVKGTTTLTSQTGQKHSETDKCNDITLTEYYCDDEGIGNIEKKCADSCEDGACV